jgi:hypothetical protein
MGIKEFHMPTNEELQDLVSQIVKFRDSEALYLDTLTRFHEGRAGAPSVDAEVDDNVKRIASQSVDNVLDSVVNSFVEGLKVNGLHRADSTENVPAWQIFMRNRMASRQDEVHSAALIYGVGYVTVLPGRKGPVIRTASPVMMTAVYEDPALDIFPLYALEIYTANVGGVTRRMGRLLDSENYWTIDFGKLTNSFGITSLRIESISEPTRHGATYEGAAVTPVVRFVNKFDANKNPVGEIEPLIPNQVQLNDSVFKRSLVAEYGATPKLIISGWEPKPDDQIASSPGEATALPNPAAKPHTIPAAALSPYTELIKEQKAAIATKAQIAPSHITGDLINLSSDAIALTMENYQRKLRAKRETFGDSWLVVFRLAASYEGDDITEADESAQVSWVSTETYTLAQVGDFFQKMSTTKVPQHFLTRFIPGMTQQDLVAINEEMGLLGQGEDLINGMLNLGRSLNTPVEDEEIEEDDA